MATGTLVGGVVSALRWGVFKGMQTTEAGIGTQTIPHSMAETSDPVAQRTIAMLSTYSAGFVALLSGCVALITGTWQDPSLPLGISMVAASFQLYFSYFGLALVAISAFLFAFGTILGNCYNGSHCFSYLTTGKGIWYYFIGCAVWVFLGSISEVKLIWSLSDLVMACVALPHMSVLIYHAFRKTQAVEATA
jgi:alanine or glycine:cation symporter, AGCS family